ncbi:MAG: cytochrome-c peroxidase [Rhodocyclales bacterium]|nr:cytochrome-c peroxidase [Rhodocyclales bacterium]
MKADRLPKSVSATLLLGAVAVACLWLWLPRAEGPRSAEAGPGVVAHSGDALAALPPVPRLPAAKVALGRALFKDVRLSRDDSIACASCHDLAGFGHDSRRVSVGVGGAEGSVNAPTVFNASLNFVQFWDGRAGSLEEQAAGPVHNPLEMASDWATVIGKLQADAAFGDEFRRAYPDGITAANLADAIATFERTLLTENSPFDRYLRGDQQAIDERARLGLRRFRDLGCASCHQGVNVGGNMFQRFGVMGDYFGDRARQRPAVAADLGRFNVTGQEVDRHVFKVPSLRNVAETAPYFHDGSVASLAEAVAIMGRYQLGRELSRDEVDTLLAFLKTLSGMPPASLTE